MTHLFSLGSNPFSTPVGQMIEKATDVGQPSENWALFMEVCDLIIETEDGPKDAAKAIKKRLNHNAGKQYQVVMYTLTLLETCVKNCGLRFHVQIAHKDFLQEMIKVIGPKNDPPQIVQERVLSLIQTWADAFQGIPELKEVNKVYQELKNKGIDFPATDLDHMAPIHTPVRTAPGLDPPQPIPQRAPSARSHHQSTRSPPHTQQPPYPVAQIPHVMPQQPPPTGPVMLGPEQLAKLKNEMDIVEQNIKVFSEMLTEMNPTQEHQCDLDLLQDLNRTCKEMQQRIMELIEQVQNEEVTGELLRLNDDLNNVFLRFERFQRLRSSQLSASVTSTATITPAATQPSPAALQPPPPGSHPASHAPPPYPTGDSAIGNLIDLGDGDTSKPAAAATNPADISLQLAGLNLGSNTVTGTLNQLDSTASSNVAPDDDFEMFAQSRQSFDQNKQAPAGSAYANQVYDQYSGSLGSAVAAKATGNTQLIDKESDYREMEEWVKANPLQAPPHESATSTEFDNFLAERAQVVDSAPDSGSNQQRQTRPGRQMQADDTDNALFAL